MGISPPTPATVKRTSHLWKTIFHNNRYQQTLITVQKPLWHDSEFWCCFDGILLSPCIFNNPSTTFQISMQSDTISSKTQKSSKNSFYNSFGVENYSHFQRRKIMFKVTLQKLSTNRKMQKYESICEINKFWFYTIELST